MAPDRPQDLQSNDTEVGDPEEEGEDRHSFLREIPVLVLLALVVALFIKTFLVQAFFIPSSSMEPTLIPGDRVLVNKLSYDLHDVHRGDVIVFERPEEPNDVPHPENEIPDLIKTLSEKVEGRDI